VRTYAAFSFTSDISYFLSPDRWDDLPEKVKEIPGKMTHLLSFSVGPRVSFLISSPEPDSDLIYEGLSGHAVLHDRDENSPLHLAH